MLINLTLKEIDLIIFIIISFTIIFFFLKSSFSLLLLSELFWITFYFASLLLALLNDNLTFCALSLFCLIFSSVEICIGIGLVNFKFKLFKNYNLK